MRKRGAMEWGRGGEEENSRGEGWRLGGEDERKIGEEGMRRGRE